MSQELSDPARRAKGGNEGAQMGTRGIYSIILLKSTNAFTSKVLEQRFQKLQAERDDLHSNFVSSVQEVVQKANFKKLLLERKVVALADSLEKKDAQLNEILAASNLEPAALSVVTRKLEDVLDAKNGAIKDLQVFRPPNFLVIDL